MKEKEIDALVMPWANAWVAHLLSAQRATATVEDRQVAGKPTPSEYKVVVTKNTETIDASSSYVIPVKAEKVYTRDRINVMTQALQGKDGLLPQGLTMQNAYTELRLGSKNAVVVVRNSTAYPPNSQEEIPGGSSSGCHSGARATSHDPLAGGGRSLTVCKHLS